MVRLHYIRTTFNLSKLVLTVRLAVYNIANKHLENETLNTLKRRLAKLRGPVIPQVRSFVDVFFR